MIKYVRYTDIMVVFVRPMEFESFIDDLLSPVIEGLRFPDDCSNVLELS